MRKSTTNTTRKKETARKKLSSRTGKTKSPGFKDSPVNKILFLQKTIGNKAVQRLMSSCPLNLPSPKKCPFGGICDTCPAFPVQTKLTINKPGDRYEQEAGSADASQKMNAKAFTIGNDIFFGYGSDVVFGSGQYSSGTELGKRLLGHELVHVIQQSYPRIREDNIIRRDMWEESKKSREMEPHKIPKTFNYELIHHELWAHTSTKSDIVQIVELIATLNAYFGKTTDKGDITKKLEASWKEATRKGGRGSINITSFLPERLRKYLGVLGSYYKIYQDFLSTHKIKGEKDKDLTGMDRVDILDYYEDLIKDAKGNHEEKDRLEKERAKKIKEYEKKLEKKLKENGFTEAPEERDAACHNFLMLVISGSPEGVEPRRYATTKTEREARYQETIKMDLEKIVDSLTQSLKGRGPFRIVSKKDVRIGDIAVFKAGVNYYDRKKEIDVKKGEILHSAMVIRISDDDIELLEKKNPFWPMGTRTVKEIKKYWSAIYKPTVHFLAPTIKGMPGKSRRGLGLHPPTEKFTVATGKAPEDTYVLFKVNTNITLPHEDRKLFEFIARYKKPVGINVHGYASREGGKKYNLNLSAHRAVAVGKALKSHLPGGSKAESFARGETSEFGPPRENRRAGIELEKPPVPVEKETGGSS